MAEIAEIHPGLSAFLRDVLTDNADKVIKYLEEKAFSPEGQMVIGSIFAFAKDHEISVEKVIAEADKEWVRNWQYQHPEIRGSADAPGAAGMQNRASLNNIYQALGIPNPASM